jgi:hypothetical protein
MNVKELRDELAKFPDQTPVLVYWEDRDRQKFFQIDDLSMPKGTGLRDAEGKPGFKFEGKGPAARVLVNVSPEE